MLSKSATFDFPVLRIQKKLLFGIVMCAAGWSFTGCTDHQIEGSSFTETGLEYKILYMGEEERKLEDKDLAEVRWELPGSDRDGVTSGAAVIEYRSQKDSGLMELLGMLYIGDSAAFAAEKRAADLLGIPGEFNFPVPVNLKLLKTADERETHLEKRYPGIIALADDADREHFYGVLDTLEDHHFRDINGVYYFESEKGNGAEVEPGREVVLHYEGYLLSGKKFDSTFDRGKSFAFFAGDPDQLLKGLEYVVNGLREGARGVAVIPPRYAFGSGSADGSVGANKAVIYTLYVAKVNPPDNE